MSGYAFEDLGNKHREVISRTKNFKILVTGRLLLRTWRKEETHKKLLRETRHGYGVVGHVLYSHHDLYVRSIFETSANILETFAK